MNEPWYYSRDGATHGPVEEGEIKHLIASGVISRTTLLWKEGQAQWEPAENAFGGFPQGPPPLPKVGATPRPPLGTSPATPGPKPRRTLRFETEPQATAQAAAVPAHTTAPLPRGPVPTALPLSAKDAVAGVFVLGGSIFLAALSGLAGSLAGYLVFLGVLVVTSLAFMVRIAFFLYKAWNALPWKYRSRHPLFAAVSIFIPVANLYFVFRSIAGLSRQTNAALKDRGLAAKAPETLGMASAISFVVVAALGLALPWVAVQVLLSVAQLALLTLWMVEQGKATNTLMGHQDTPAPSLPWLIGNAACGGLALLLAAMVGFANLRAAATMNAAPEYRQQSTGDWDQPAVGQRGTVAPVNPQTPRSPWLDNPWKYADPPARTAPSFDRPNLQTTPSTQRPSSNPQPSFSTSSPQSQTCGTCGGSGNSSNPCFACHGSGKGSNGLACSFCHGRGFQQCPFCRGTGRTRP